MKIRTRLTLLFTLITAGILFLFAFAIYYSAREDREEEFYSRLEEEAYIKANLFFNVHVDREALQKIYKNNRKVIHEVEVAVYDTGFHLLYHDADDIDVVKETPQMIDRIRKTGLMKFYLGNWQVVGLKYAFQGKDYIITATAYDLHGYNKLDNMIRSSIFIFITAILLIYFAGIFFAGKAFQPVSEMISRVKTITATNLDLRLDTRESKDELSALAGTFNEMLDRLENSFDTQKQFVSNISHELRTPLTSLLAELELTSQRERSSDEYREVVLLLIKDVQKLIRLSNNLLDLAKANYDRSEIAFRAIRIDEVLLDARHQVQKNGPDYNIDIRFENETEDEKEISVEGNEYLLQVAFVNLFDNGCKFSDDHRSTALIRSAGGKIRILFSDAGIGIPETDLPHIFSPFFRGDNGHYAEGNGIGLSLTKRIIQLHKGTISVTSGKSRGTVFTIELPSLPGA